MDEFGMKLKLNTPAPDWTAAREYVREVREAGDDEDTLMEVLDRYPAGYDDTWGELTCEMPSVRDLESVIELIEAALAGSSEWAKATTVNGSVIVETTAETGADSLVESMWRLGPLAAAGFTVS